jgi:alkanesulfonate monooxygenase SsuD/methylene tetrahydromethanopterin reductase-like flavin-dependent oxidoreductase (luciferase family)
VREHIPIYLAAIGPKSLALAGEIADGWMSVQFSPDHADDTLGIVRQSRESAGKSMQDFEVIATTSVVFGDDLEACADSLRPGSALYIGGMGSRKMNFYNQNVRRMGYEQAAQEVQDKYLAKDYLGAQAALPFELLDQISLIGPPERIADRLQAYAQAGVTNLTFTAVGETIQDKITSVRMMAEVLDLSGCAS